MLKAILESTRALPWKIGTKMCTCSPPMIMGIVNVTPDSFFDGGKYSNTENAIGHAIELLNQGADILDIGGESSRPGSAKVPLQQELDRVCPVIDALSKLNYSRDFFISVDTVKSKVATEAIKLGAHIINDISACTLDSDMPKVIAHSKVSVVLNHMRGNFGTMQQDFLPYKNVVYDVANELLANVKTLLNAGVEKEKICIDPGIGFGKTVQNNIDLIKSLDEFLSYGYPVLLGTSRKSYIGKIEGLQNSDRLIPTIAAGIVAHLGGVSCIRVHDVRETKESLLYMGALRHASV